MEDDYELIDSDWEFVDSTEKESNEISQVHNQAKELFLKKCIEKNIALEGLVVSVLLTKNSLVHSVFSNCIARASRVTEHGDAHTALRAVAQWCSKLHSKTCQTESQQNGWLKQNGLKAKALKHLDECLRECFAESHSLFSSKAPVLNFRQDVNYVHETITAALVDVWWDRLCVYRGHKDLGYLEISSNVPIRIGRKSCFRLTSRPPTFALYLDNADRAAEANIWVSAGNEMSSAILKKYHKTTAAEVRKRCTLVPIIVKHVGPGLGSLAVSENLGQRLKSVCWCTVEVFYNDDRKELNVLCPENHSGQVRSSLEIELEKLRLKLEDEVIEVPYPDAQSLLRLEIGRGFVCRGIVGVQLFPDERLTKISSTTHEYNSENLSLDAETFALRVRDTNGDTLKDDDILHNLDNESTSPLFQHSDFTLQQVGETNKKTEQDGTYCIHDNDCNPASLSPCCCDDVVVFNSATTISLIRCRPTEFDSAIDNISKEFDLPQTEDSFSKSLAAIKHVLCREGHRAIFSARGSDTLIWRFESDPEAWTKLNIRFPSLYSARTGLKCLEENRLLTVEQSKMWEEELRKICIEIRKDLFEMLQKQLQEKLARLMKENAIVSHEIRDITRNRVHCPGTTQKVFKVCIQMRIADSCHVHKITDAFSTLLQPTDVVIDESEMVYFRSYEGKRFLKFLSEFTMSLVHIPEYQRRVRVYGSAYRRGQSAAILKRQLAKDSCASKWHLCELGKPSFVSNAVQIWSQELLPYTVQLQLKGTIKQFWLIQDRLELWVETTPKAFNTYCNLIQSKLGSVLKGNSCLGNVDGISDEPTTCTICFEAVDVASERCYVLSACGHAYCVECLIRMITTSAGEHKVPIGCANSCCTRLLSAWDLWYLCGWFQYCDAGTLQLQLLSCFAKQHIKTLSVCPDDHCRGVGLIRELDQTMYCLWCLKRFCTLCARKAHPDQSCGDAYSILEWVREDPANRKLCPGCTIPIEKFDGCNNVHCGWCKEYMCWKCGKFHSPIESYCQFHVNRCRRRNSDSGIQGMP